MKNKPYIIKNIKLRIYPTSYQRQIIFDTLNTCDLIWNDALEKIKYLGIYTVNFLDFFDSYGNYISRKRKNLPTEEIYGDIKTYEFLKKDTVIKTSVHNKLRSMMKILFTLKKKNKLLSLSSKTDENKSNSFYLTKSQIRHLYIDPTLDGKPLRKYIKALDKYDIKKGTLQLPVLGKMKYRNSDLKKESLQLPYSSLITSGRISIKNEKFYLILNYKHEILRDVDKSPGCGLDVGVINFCTIYFEDGTYVNIENFIYDKRIVRLNERVEKIRKIISLKVNKNIERHKKIFPELSAREIKKLSYASNNIRKMYKKITLLNEKILNIENDIINKLIHRLVIKIKPRFISIETLSVSNMLKDDKPARIHDLIQKSRFSYFLNRLEKKAVSVGREIRKADINYPSTLLCSNCGNKAKSVNLKTRIYECRECGLKMDIDLNAAINLCNYNSCG